MSRGNVVEADEVDESDIVERIFDAVIEQRLPPGTKLSESALCEAFGVGRMRIRRSLLLLASREVVELHANRGAFVASPTPEQAREVFEARLALEPNIARLAVQRASAEDIAALTRHLEMEYVAHKERRRHDAIRLSGQFHTLLAQVAGNAILIRTMKELVTRTSLIIGLFGAGVSNCRDDDHAAIVGAFHTRDAEKAAWMMTLHLRHIQDHLELGTKSTDSVDLMELFRKP
ncbi:GntR family transcriptional regulator [Shinella kummerowiae]|uniref:GntR family transcriptional regulator n=1 Tax=Shinella kummerowiae TaxID=417745 RepID=UPI0021B688FB|nr:GntR family transcriptional regulator [Shinella kummerowiae]MCT7664785.1 GntR family transcriptional regulator [Shinella kummerowiae]